MKTSYWHFFISVFFQTTELCHLAPSPSSATRQWAVEVAGAPSTAAAATCPALTTHQGSTSRSNCSRSTSLTRDHWATPPRRAWTHPTLHHRSCPVSFWSEISDTRLRELREPPFFLLLITVDCSVDAEKCTFSQTFFYPILIGKGLFYCCWISSQKQFCGIIHPGFAQWHSRKRFKMSLK